MRIANIDLDREILIVAEIGNNHEGSYARAEEMIRRIAKTGVHAVKFQTFRTELFIRQHDAKRFAQLKSFELTYDEFEKLAHVAKSEGLIFLSTPFDLESAEFLNSLVPAFKIASSDNTFYPLLDTVIKYRKPIILSSGLVDLEQLHAIISYIEKQGSKQNWKPELAVLHCVCNYPVNPANANLATILQLKAEVNHTIGYSDHTLGIDAAVYSAVLGARIIEKHVTLDKNLSSFRDHQLSATPDELTELVRKVKQVSELMGTGTKTIQADELAMNPLVRRSIVARYDLSAGHTLQWQDMMWTRPGNGLPPGQEKQLLGRTLKNDIRAGDLLLPDLFSDSHEDWKPRVYVKNGN